MLDIFGTDEVMSCVNEPMCFMLGALVVCVFGASIGVGFFSS